MLHLLPGLKKFSQEVFPQQKGLFEGLSQGQKPRTMLFTCCDSRIDPTLVTQTAPGELFIVRNAGNIIPPFGTATGAEEAAVEFAIEGLKVESIIVCGHTHCGAMAALMNENNLDSMPSLKKWLVHAQTTKKRVLADPGTPASLQRMIEENVLVQVDHLKTHPSVGAALKAKRLQIYGWVYHFELGAVTVYDQVEGIFVPSTDIKDESEQVLHRYSF